MLHGNQRICDDLVTQGFSIDAEFLSPAEIEEIAQDFQNLRDNKSFQRAGIGQGIERRIEDEIRRDQIFWFDPTSLTSGQARLWSKLEALQVTLNRNLFLSLRTIEGHYAYYPPGGFYQRHLDRFSNDDARTVSAVVYLNSQWKPGDGGELVIYPARGPHENSPPTLVEPRAGTLACFLSGLIEHEVRESFRPRLSFAGWYKRRVSHLDV